MPLQKAASASTNGLSLLTQATVRIQDSETKKIIYIDPFKVTRSETADLILITHPHFDHCDPNSVKQLYKPNHTMVIGPQDCLQKLPIMKADGRPIRPNEETEVGGITVQTIPAYNIFQERLHYHPKTNNWVGYVLLANKETIYHAGDTDEIEEMSKLRNLVNLGFLPVGGTYTMDADEAAKAVERFDPDIAVPMHAIPAGTRALEMQQKFKRLVEAKGKTKVELINGKGSFD